MLRLSLWTSILKTHVPEILWNKAKRLLKKIHNIDFFYNFFLNEGNHDSVQFWNIHRMRRWHPTHFVYLVSNWMCWVHPPIKGQACLLNGESAVFNVVVQIAERQKLIERKVEVQHVTELVSLIVNNAIFFKASNFVIWYKRQTQIKKKHYKICTQLPMHVVRKTNPKKRYK